jgi:autotransporter-associated beta strand protein
MKKEFAISCALAFGALLSQPAPAQILYREFLVPEFDGNPNTEASIWSVFYAARILDTGKPAVNFPDAYAPYGGTIVSGQKAPVSRSAAGFEPNDGYNPADPLAFWDVRNPTISQKTNSAFIIGAGGQGNIYSFADPLELVVNDSTSYALGTVAFQFQTAGTVVDFDSIRLVYIDNGGQTQSLPASDARADIMREFGGSGSDRGGIGNRTAVQWDLSGLGITTYEIQLTAEDASLSFQQAVLDTAAEYSPVVPKKRSWDAGGGADNNWTTASNWSDDTVPGAGANVTFASGGTVNLNASPMVGELIFAREGSFRIDGSGDAELTVNTGISANPATASSYTINVPIKLGGYNFNEIGANATVTLNGAVRGSAFTNVVGQPVETGGIVKRGEGTLVINGNIEASVPGGVGLRDGTLVLRGTNAYRGETYVDGGTLVIGSNALPGQPGALGTSTNAIDVGMDLAGSPIVLPAVARILIDGPYQVGRAFKVLGGNETAVFGGQNTGAGAVFSGSISLSASNLAAVHAAAASDRVAFTATISGGAADKTLTKTGAGSVIFSGVNKSYANATVVAAGTLEIASGTAVNGNGAWTVNAGANLRVNGTLAGTGDLSLNAGTLSGNGAVNKAVAIGAGAVLSPGNSVGMLAFGAAQTWSGGGMYLWEIGDAGGAAGAGWDLASVNGAIDIASTAGSRFTLLVTSVTLEGMAGPAANFDPNLEYSWVIASSSAEFTGFAGGKFALDLSGFSNAYNGSFELLQAGNELVLTYVPIPEPGVWALLAAAGVWLSLVRRLGAGCG